ncbi:paraquat-inducible protein A [Maricaulis sp.]|uniref:paraquat-inducible protein A n=1 Tax=Maricaulis sp. TaxID=1486257 RepID=UPI00261232B7|nr:paraquat-inducible protein A [Maricaulis sp.]
MRALADEKRGQMSSALLLLTSVLFPLGLILPAVETTHVWLWRGEHSIAGFGLALLEAEEYLLATIVWIFSLIFPAIKLIWMWRLQFRRGELPSHGQVRLLELLGKWSMADVLVIALLVLTVRGNFVFGAAPLPGLFVFALAVALSMIVSGRIQAQLRARQSAGAAVLSSKD